MLICVFMVVDLILCQFLSEYIDIRMKCYCYKLYTIGTFLKFFNIIIILNFINARQDDSATALAIDSMLGWFSGLLLVAQLL